MFNIITFGSATYDIFIKPEKFQKIFDKKKFITGKGICFNLGSKIDIKEILFSSGGGGTNTATTFAKQGFSVAYCGSVGQDIAGTQIMEELKNLGVNTDLIFKNSGKPTNHSIVLSGLNDDRTIFVYRGASEILDIKNVLGNIEAKWFYLAPLSGELSNIFEELVDFANKRGIKVAVNPGTSQLLMPKEKLAGIFKKIDILILNQEEASFLTKIPFQKEKQIFQKIDEICPGIAIMTCGSKGVVVSDGKNLYKAKALKVKVADRTGAGDSFASGFVSEFMRSNGDITASIQLGIANANGCLTKVGAKNGLLEKGQNFEKAEVKITKI